MSERPAWDQESVDFGKGPDCGSVESEPKVLSNNEHEITIDPDLNEAALRLDQKDPEVMRDYTTWLAQNSGREDSKESFNVFEDQYFRANKK